MKKLFFILIVIVISYPTFASCPISDTSSACVAEFQSTGIPEIPAINPKLNIPAGSKVFIKTPSTVESAREIQPRKNLRNSSGKSSDYGYNANCQFGVCQNSGMPKLFPQNNN